MLDSIACVIISKWCPLVPIKVREDFERTGISTLVTVGVQDIQGEDFPISFLGWLTPYFWTYPNLG
ncbi:hypothetical protein PVK06_032995 [Gossypium arboreum]|uniref:Uncharacterized protein n=1 Tax=Gossypium arboreum TaxID=29729 RepID=A0ABR0NB17_GOSAR|nr:hypothetical protein PVK06_032995 [Gossypium arboreum]